MKRITFAIAALALLMIVATAGSARAQSGCSITVTPVNDGHDLYEIAGTNFLPGSKIHILAKNKQTHQSQIFFIELAPSVTDFSGQFIGIDSFGEYIPVSPGKWKVKVTASTESNTCKAKKKFRVVYTSNITTAPPGEWGGRSVALSLSQDKRDVEFDCAHGSIDEPLVLDDTGRFDVAGTFTHEHPGPVHEDENFIPLPARYSGWTDGKTMMLMVHLTDTDEEIGPFYLTLGDQARLAKCL